MVVAESDKRLDYNEKLTGRDRSLANLIHAKPGEIKNPAGRPKNEFLVSPELAKELRKIPELLPDGSENTEKLSGATIFARNLVKQANAGNSKAIDAVLDRVEGKVVEKVEQTINDVTPIKDMTPAERKNRIIEILKATNRN